MSRAWPLVALGEVLTQVSRAERVEPAKEYRLLGVRLEGEGPFLRETKLGSQSSANQLFKVQEGDFIYSRLFAWRGAFGVVGTEHDGCYVSNEFPTFQSVSEKIDVKFLRYWFRLPATIAAVEADCTGSTPLTRNRFKEQFFLSLKTPLPPIEEQRRIVARIEELAVEIEEARGLRRLAVEEVGLLISASLSKLCRSSAWESITVERLIGEEGLKNGKSVKPSDDGEGIRCLTLSAMRNGRIDLRINKPIPLVSSEAKPYLVKKGDVFIVRGNGSKELCGLAGLVAEDCNSLIFPDLFIRVPIPSDQMLPEFFVLAWNSASTREVIEEKAKTTSGIWKINQGHILSTQIPIPPLAEQRRIVAYLDDLQAKVDSLKRLQTDTAAELDAMLPSILDKAFQGVFV